MAFLSFFFIDGANLLLLIPEQQHKLPLSTYKAITRVRELDGLAQAKCFDAYELERVS